MFVGDPQSVELAPNLLRVIRKLKLRHGKSLSLVTQFFKLRQRLLGIGLNLRRAILHLPLGVEIMAGDFSHCQLCLLIIHLRLNGVFTVGAGDFHTKGFNIGAGLLETVGISLNLEFQLLLIEFGLKPSDL